MKLLVHAGTLGPEDRRMTLAARGLELRGHEVSWRGEIDSGEPKAGAALGVARLHVDVALGGGAKPSRVARSGWLARARAMVLALDRERVGGWSHWQRWCWESIESGGLVDAAEVERLTSGRVAIDPARLAAWMADGAPESPDPTHPDVELLERWCERTLARRRSRRRAVFLDRDGTLIVEKGYVGKPEEVELLPHVPEALRLLQSSGFALVVVSNQAGVARELYPLSQAYATMARLRELLRAHGIELDAIYFCPHHPDDDCPCRKPRTALFERAAQNLGLSLHESAMVGDKLIDVAAGQRVRGLGVLVRTGYGREEAQREAPRPPDRVCDDLLEAARWIAGRASERIE